MDYWFGFRSNRAFQMLDRPARLRNSVHWGNMFLAKEELRGRPTPAARGCARARGCRDDLFGGSSKRTVARTRRGHPWPKHSAWSRQAPDRTPKLAQD